MKIPPQRLNDGNPEDTPASFPGDPLRMAPPQKKRWNKNFRSVFVTPLSVSFLDVFFSSSSSGAKVFWPGGLVVLSGSS